MLPVLLPWFCSQPVPARLPVLLPWFCSQPVPAGLLRKHLISLGEAGECSAQRTLLPCQGDISTCREECRGEGWWQKTPMASAPLSAPCSLAKAMSAPAGRNAGGRVGGRKPQWRVLRSAHPAPLPRRCRHLQEGMQEDQKMPLAGRHPCLRPPLPSSPIFSSTMWRIPCRALSWRSDTWSLVDERCQAGERVSRRLRRGFDDAHIIPDRQVAQALPTSRQAFHAALPAHSPVQALHLPSVDELM